MSKFKKLRWMNTPEGVQVLNAISDLVDRQIAQRPAAVTAVATAAGDADSQWEEGMTDFFNGLYGALGTSGGDVDAEFRARLTDAYHKRFFDGFAGLDPAVVKLQANILGILTANMYRLERGELQGGNYPQVNPNAALSVEHLEWARDVIGFWVAQRTRWTTGLPPQQTTTVPTAEFDNGCSLC
ncbi:MAG TPA: hypothetical protein VEZ11_12100 [Thermoanaerobaculia bacterium]|nr:hypothetical protein [Thermoanaerobaculia bacterium]